MYFFLLENWIFLLSISAPIPQKIYQESTLNLRLQSAATPWGQIVFVSLFYRPWSATLTATCMLIAISHMQVQQHSVLLAYLCYINTPLMYHNRIITFGGYPTVHLYYVLSFIEIYTVCVILFMLVALYFFFYNRAFKRLFLIKWSTENLSRSCYVPAQILLRSYHEILQDRGKILQRIFFNQGNVNNAYYFPIQHKMI